MKRIKYFIFTLLAATTTFVSCDLDRNPLDKFAENDFWTSEDNAELALTGVYKGNILFASHDHEFIETVANRIIELTPNGIIDKMMEYDEYITSDHIKELRTKMYNK